MHVSDVKTVRQPTLLVHKAVVDGEQGIGHQLGICRCAADLQVEDLFGIVLGVRERHDGVSRLGTVLIDDHEHPAHAHDIEYW